MWKDVPVPFFMSVYFFNILNPKEILKGEKPMVEQRGPYVYRYADSLTLFISTLCPASCKCVARRIPSSSSLSLLTSVWIQTFTDRAGCELLLCGGRVVSAAERKFLGTLCALLCLWHPNPCYVTPAICATKEGVWAGRIKTFFFPHFPICWPEVTERARWRQSWFLSGVFFPAFKGRSSKGCWIRFTRKKH